MKHDYISPVCYSMTIHAESILCQCKEIEGATNESFGLGHDYDIL